MIQKRAFAWMIFWIIVAITATWFTAWRMLRHDWGYATLDSVAGIIAWLHIRMHYVAFKGDRNDG